MIFFNCYKSKFAKQIADMFFLKIRRVYNIISRSEKEGRLDLKGSTCRPKKVTQRVERKVIGTVYNNPQSSTNTRGLALKVRKDFELCASHETVRNVLQNTNILQDLLSAQNVKKRFTSSGVLR